MNPSSGRNRLPRILAILSVIAIVIGIGTFAALKLRHKSTPRTTKTQHEALIETIAIPAANFEKMQRYAARPVSEFISFLGVNGSSVNPPDYPGYFRETLIPTLQELGITRYRVVIPSRPDPDTEHIENLRRLYTEANVRSILTLKLKDGKNNKLTSNPSAVKAVVNLLGAAVEAVEGPNEYDHEDERPDLEDFPKWTKDLYDYMKEIRSELPPDTPLLGPTFVGMNRRAGLRRTDVGNYDPQLIDYGNIHTYEYPYDTQKNKSKGRDNYERLEKHAYQRQIYRQFAPSKIYVTETGCPTIPDLGKGVTEAEQAKYLPRQLLTLFNRGYRAACIFEMRDSGNDPKDIQKNYGILRADGSKKPSYIALKNLFDILRANDIGTTTRSNNLDYSITGDTKNLNQTLLQNRAGVFFLILWNDVDGSEPASAATLTINLKLAPRQTTMFNPLQNSTVANQQTAPGNSITVPVADSPIVVQITP